MKTQEVTIELKGSEIEINEYRVLVVDAPENATHSSVAFQDGLNYLIRRKSKILGIYTVDQSDSDSKLAEKYEHKFLYVGSLKTADEIYIANLFNPVKRGNFYDYEYNCVFYPSAVSALKDIVEQVINFKNPYVLIIKK